MQKSRDVDENTQVGKILKYLMTGQAITPLIALQVARCLRLSQRIIEIEELGWRIKRERVRTSGGAQVMSYRLLP